MPGDLSTFVRGLFPRASPQLRSLHQSVVDSSTLRAVDFLSIQDLLAIASYSDEENLHVLLLLMFLALEEGSLSIEVSQPALAGRLADLAGEEQAGYWPPRILAGPGTQRFGKLIGSSLNDSRPVLRLAHGDKQYLYFHKYLRSEMALYDELNKRLRSPGETTPSSKIDWQPILHEVLQDRPLRLAGRTLQLDPHQALALNQALLKNFVIISGGPGTGKTSIVLTLLRCLVRAGMQPGNIALAAPTGRAAQRLSDSLRSGLERIAPAPAAEDLLLHQLQAGTLHRLLEYSPSRGQFRKHAENPLAADVVIVDEVSMVGVVLMAQLMQALRPDCKLILLGDKDQLPSVEAGAVLASLVPRKTGVGADESRTEPDHVVLLETNHRSQPDIQAAAQAINQQDAGVADRLPSLTLPGKDRQSAWWKAIERQGGCWLVESAGGGAAAVPSAAPNEFRSVLQCWAGHHFLDEFPQKIRDCVLRSDSTDDPATAVQLRQLFRMLDGSRILTLVREGMWGSVGINAYLDSFLRPHLDRGSRGRLFAGAPVLITANDHVRQLNNGDVGLVLKSVHNGEESLRAVFPRRDGFLSFAVEGLPSHELGLAMTVHKSQGSEYDSVLLVLPPSGARRLLTKEILYTGITRARNLALIAGSRETLRLSIRRRIVRESAMMND